MFSSTISNNSFHDTGYAISKQIDEIANSILERKQELANSNLLDGNAGIVLLFAYLAKLFPEKNYLQATFDLLDELGNSLANDELDFHLSTGVAGIAFTFQHLRNIGVLDQSTDLNLSELDEFIASAIDQDFEAKNWDPLHGMTGLGIYFLERNKETDDRKFLEKIVDKLSLLRRKVDDYNSWITPGYGKYLNDNYNFGMAHGMPGVLSFLAQVYDRGIRQKEIREMIFSCLPFLLQHEYENDAGFSFPSSIEVGQKEKEKISDSRLAWCYGDLCMANVLVHCGKALHENSWRMKGINLALKTTRINFENTGCRDAPFCHGTMGVAHQYQRFYKLTGDEIFKYAVNNWIDLTLKHYYKPGEGAGGYSFRTRNEVTNLFEFVPQYGLLEGSAGIALVCLSLLHNVEPGWDIIFLCNI